MVPVFIKYRKSKRVKWTSPRQVMNIDTESGSVTVPGRSSKTVCSAVKDVRTLRDANELSNPIKDSIDEEYE